MKCIFLDIDGTLLDHEVGIQPSTIHAIKQAQANGHKVCIATGRAKPEVDKSILDIGFDGYIYSCGCLVEVDDTILFKQYMDLHDTKKLIELLHKHHIGFNLEGIYASFLDDIGYSFFQNLFVAEHQVNSEFARQQMASYHMNSYNDIKQSDLYQIVKVATFAHEQEACIAFQNELPSHLRFLLHGTQDSSLINGEILPCDISKATGMEYLLHYYKIPLADSFAIGDSVNDIDMIVHANTGIAMENAHEALKRRSDDITTSSKNDGIYNSFHKYNLL